MQQPINEMLPLVLGKTIPVQAAFRTGPTRLFLGETKTLVPLQLRFFSEGQEGCSLAPGRQLSDSEMTCLSVSSSTLIQPT